MAIPGSVVAAGKLVAPGGAQGPVGPNAVSTDSGNLATLGSDGLVLVPQSTIWNQRLRSFNAIGNPNFEVDQRNVHGGTSNPASGTFLCDRWSINKVGTMTVNSGNPTFSPPNGIPGGIPFGLSSVQLSLQLATQQASLAAGDYLFFNQLIEGCNWREMANDVTSLSLMVYSSVAPLKFSVAIRDAATVTRSLVKLCTVPVANTWTLIQLPNIPKPTSGNFSTLPGAAGCGVSVALACGATFMAPAADTWQNGNFLGAPGMDNWCANPITSSVFYLGFVQHEPGPLCTTFIDKPFSQNLDECLRYFQKSYPYGMAVGSVGGSYARLETAVAAAGTYSLYGPVAFLKRMAKTPTVIAYHHGNGTPHSVYIWYASSGTIPNAQSTASISAYAASDIQITNMTASGNSTSQIIAVAEWTADTGW